MKLKLLAGISAAALLAGIASARAQDTNDATATNDLTQTSINSASVVADERGEDGSTIAGGSIDALNNNFGIDTFRDQAINQNNINSGINSAQQGANALAVAVDNDGNPTVANETNTAEARNTAMQTSINTATVDGDDADAADNMHGGEGIASETERSLNNNFGETTFQDQAINQNNINSGINSAQQGGNSVAIAVDMDGNAASSINTAIARNGDAPGGEGSRPSRQIATNTATVTSTERHRDNDGIGSETEDSLNNDWRDDLGRESVNRTFRDQAINQNNINSGINSAQQGANTVAVAATPTPSQAANTFAPLTFENQQAINGAMQEIADAIGLPIDALFGSGASGELIELNSALATTNISQLAANTATNDSFGRRQIEIPLPEITAEQIFDILCPGGECADPEAAFQLATIIADALPPSIIIGGETDGGIGGDNFRSLQNLFGSETFMNQVLNQNNINAGINSAQQGANTVAIAVDQDPSNGSENGRNVSDTNVAVARTQASQVVANTATTSNENNDGVGGSDRSSGDALWNSFGSETFRHQAINQNNINAGINSGQQGAGAAAIAVDDSPSNVDNNRATAETSMNSTVVNSATDSSQGERDANDRALSGLGIGGNPGEGGIEAPGANNLTNVFGTSTFQDQVLNQNNINAGINSAQQGANSVAIAVNFSGDGQPDNNTAVSLVTLGQVVTNTATTSGDASGGIGGHARNNALSNQFGTTTFMNQAMNQNNINSGINSAQQGSNSIAIAYSGAQLDRGDF